jgi:predicted permease
MSAALLVLPDFLLIALGALLARAFGYGASFWDGAERLVYFVLFPALLFRAIATAPLALGEAAPLVATGIGYTVAGMALSALARPLFRLEAATFAAIFQTGFRYNTYLVLAIAGSVGGADALALASLLIGVLVPLVNVAAVAMLARGGETRVLPELARNPLVLATLAGIGWKLGGWPVPAMAARGLDLLGAAALPLGLLAVGAALRFERNALPAPALAWFVAVKLAFLPAIALAFARLAGLGPMETSVALIQAAVPTATSAYILASRMNGRGAPVALVVSAGTLAAAFSVPAWLAVAGIAR